MYNSYLLSIAILYITETSTPWANWQLINSAFPMNCCRASVYFWQLLLLFINSSRTNTTRRAHTGKHAHSHTRYKFVSSVIWFMPLDVTKAQPRRLVCSIVVVAVVFLFIFNFCSLFHSRNVGTLMKKTTSNASPLRPITMSTASATRVAAGQ